MKPRSCLTRISDVKVLVKYLAGRYPDQRVKYFTCVNEGKSYPYSSKRQNERQRDAARAGVVAHS